MHPWLCVQANPGGTHTSSSFIGTHLCLLFQRPNCRNPSESLDLDLDVGDGARTNAEGKAMEVRSGETCTAGSGPNATVSHRDLSTAAALTRRPRCRRKAPPVLGRMRERWQRIEVRLLSVLSWPASSSTSIAPAQALCREAKRLIHSINQFVAGVRRAMPSSPHRQGFE